MSDTTTPGAPAPEGDAMQPPPETAAPEPEGRSPFVVLSPLAASGRVVGAGHIVNATPSQASEHAGLLRPATIHDLSIYGRAPSDL